MYTGIYMSKTLETISTSINTENKHMKFICKIEYYKAVKMNETDPQLSNWYTLENNGEGKKQATTLYTHTHINMHCIYTFYLINFKKYLTIYYFKDINI